MHVLTTHYTYLLKITLVGCASESTIHIGSVAARAADLHTKGNDLQRPR